MKRVSIIGCCGAGKSTLARQLHSSTGIPVVHLDAEFWNAGWQESDTDEFRERVREIYKRDAWIIDGHYFATMDERLACSDTVFHLDYSTPLCLWRTVGRMIRGYGKDRADCAEGCPERFDWEFLQYVCAFRKSFRKRTLELLGSHPHLTIHRFNSPGELAKYMNR